MAGFDFVARKALADERNAQARRHEALDHADAGKLHRHSQLRAERAELLVENLAHEAGFWKQQRLINDVACADALITRKRIIGMNHQHQPIAENRMNLQARRFYRQGDDANVHRAIFDLLEHLVTEVAIDADLHRGKAPAVLSESLGKYVQTGGFVRADCEHAARRAGQVGDGAERFVAQREQTRGVFEKRFARDGKPNRLPHAIKKLLPVLVFKLVNLRADRGLRTIELLTRAGKAALLGDL